MESLMQQMWYDNLYSIKNFFFRLLNLTSVLIEKKEMDFVLCDKLFMLGLSLVMCF